MLDELLVCGFVGIGSIEGLLKESKKDGANDCCLQSLAEDHEEHWDGEDVDSHLGLASGRVDSVLKSCDSDLVARSTFEAFAARRRLTAEIGGNESDMITQRSD